MRNTKPVWLISLGIAAAFIFSCGVLSLMLFRTAATESNVKADALAYNDYSIHAICTTWDWTAITKRASRVMKQKTTLPQVKDAIAKFSRDYGSLQHIDKSSVASVTTINPSDGPSTTLALTTAECTFEKQKGTIRMALSKTYGAWMIDEFHLAKQGASP